MIKEIKTIEDKAEVIAPLVEIKVEDILKYWSKEMIEDEYFKLMD